MTREYIDIALPIQSWRNSPGECGNHKTRRKNPKIKSPLIRDALKMAWSFSFAFLVVLLLSLLVIGLSTWLVNRSLRQTAVNDLARENGKALLERTINIIHFFTDRLPNHLRTLRSEIQLGDRYGLNTSDPLSTKGQLSLLIIITSQVEFVSFSLVNSFWLGTKEEYFTGVVSTDLNGSDSLTYQVSNANGILSYYRLSDRLVIAPKPFMQKDDYFPTNRSWFKIGEISPTFQWDTISFSEELPSILTVSLSGPYSKERGGEVLGVIGGSMNLFTLSATLAMFPVLQDTRLFIIDPNMFLVASNTEGLANFSDPIKPSLLDTRNSFDSVVRDTARTIQNKFGVPLHVSNKTTSELKFKDSTGIHRRATMLAVTDPYGLDWICVTVLSEKELLRSAQKATRTATIVTVCCIAGSVIIAFLVSSLTMVPLFKLSRELQNIAWMNFQNKRKDRVPSFHFYELEVMATSIRHLKHGLQCFDIYVPSDVVRVLIRNNASARLGVVKRRMTISFADVQFSYTEGISPQIIVEILQMVFTELSQIISNNGGVVDKYISECLMSLFNAPLQLEQHELCAARAALQMVETIEELNKRWISQNYPQVSIRIGLNSDTCLVGNVGSRKRVSYTVLGDAVNVASRLVSLNSRYGTKIVIGPLTREAITNQYVCRWLSSLVVKGKSEKCMFLLLCISRCVNEKANLISSIK